MTPTTLQTVGRALYGPCWQREMARQLDVSARTVNRWATGVHAVPEGVRGELIDLCRGKSETLWGMAGVLSMAPPNNKEIGTDWEGGYCAGYSVLSQKGGGQNDAGRLK